MGGTAITATLLLALLVVSQDDGLSLSNGRPAPAAAGSRTADSARAVAIAAAESSAVTRRSITGPFDCAAIREQSAPVGNCGVVTLEAGDQIDLDSETASWGAREPGVTEDLTFYGPQLDNSLPGNGLHGIAAGAVTYDSCASPAGAGDYHDWVDLRTATAGTQFCARTPLGRYAAIRLISDWTATSIRLSIVCWKAAA